MSEFEKGPENPVPEIQPGVPGEEIVEKEPNITDVEGGLEEIKRQEIEDNDHADRVQIIIDEKDKPTLQ